jgi:hypothetical protein
LALVNAIEGRGGGGARCDGDRRHGARQKRRDDRHHQPRACRLSESVDRDALRSVAIGLIALIPNLLPDMATGSLLYFLGDGMQLTSVVGLTIAFGIALDDTIHYINVVFRHHGATMKERLIAASREVGPVLVATTAVVVAGLLMTLTSGLTTEVTFGLLVVTALVMALIGDLIFLPAIMAGPGRGLFRRSDAELFDEPGADGGSGAQGL